MIFIFNQKTRFFFSFGNQIFSMVITRIFNMKIYICNICLRKHPINLLSFMLLILYFESIQTYSWFTYFSRETDKIYLALAKITKSSKCLPSFLLSGCVCVSVYVLKWPRCFTPKLCWKLLARGRLINRRKGKHIYLILIHKSL